MRSRLSAFLVEEARRDPKFIVLTGDHGYALFNDLRRECPSKFLNCGIAEQNMIGVAAGLAKMGYRPLVYGLASFIPIRVLEQIKLDLCYSPKPVTIIGDGAGTEMYKNLGASHQCTEDVACLRTLPQMTIFEPANPEELVAVLSSSRQLAGPSYIRISRH